MVHSTLSVLFFFFFFAKSLWTCHCSWPVFERDNQTPKEYQKEKKKETHTCSIKYRTPTLYIDFLLENAATL